jgi:tetratricopeptide (TPR) repeat protein
MFKVERFRAILLAAIAAVFVALPAPAQTSSGWTSVRSKNFFLIGDAAEPDIRAAAAKLEEFRRAFGIMFPTLKLDAAGTRTNVVVFRNAASYRPFKPKRSDGTADEPVAGYFQASSDTNYITLSIPEANADRFGTIYHEYLHYLVEANAGGRDLPPWLNEGLAEYFETLRVSGRTVSLGGPRRDHLDSLRGAAPIPMSTLFATENSELHSGSDAARNIFYAQSWAVVRLLVERSGPSNAERIGTILAMIDGSADAEKAAREALGTTDDVARKGIGELVAESPQSSSILVSMPEAAAPVGTAARPLPESEVDAYLGDLLYHTDRKTEAVEYLRRALAADPRQPAAHASLGLLLMRQEKYAEAKPHLEIAAAAPDALSFVVFNYAYSIVREAADSAGDISEIGPDRRAKIEAELRRSIELKPDFAESYRLLAFVRMVDGDTLEEAATLAKKAIELDPANDENSLLLAQIFLKQEKYQDARNVAERLATLSVERHIRAEALAVLDAVKEYFAASAETQRPQVFARAGNLPPLILKRSSVTDAEIAKFEEDRIITNLNRLLPRPKPGERQIVAYVDRVQCRDDSVDFYIIAAGQRSIFTSGTFSEVGLSVITEGERSFKIDCGSRFGKQLTVLTYVPPPDLKSRPKLVSITFVPDIFRLKSPEEMAKARIVVVEDDTRKRPSTAVSP